LGTSEQEYKKRRRQLPPLIDLDKEFEERDRIEMEAACREWQKNRILHSDEPADRLAVKAVAAGLISYASIEEIHTSHSFEHKKGFFGRSTDRESHSRTVRRTVLER